MADRKDLQEAYWDKAGMPRVPLSEALWQIETSLKTNQTRGVWMLISEAGEGKSQSVNALLERNGYRVCDIRTAALTHVGAGVPQRAENGVFKYAVPEDFPQPNERAAIVFDEVNQGQPFAIALIFRMLEDRSLYGYKLPDDAPVILLMNPGTNHYNVSKIESNPAINRRVKKLYVYNTFQDWKKHAQSDLFHRGKDFPDNQARPCHPLVVSYLTATPNQLYAAAERDLGKQFACPATWQTVSHDLYTLEHVGAELTGDRAMARIGASINTTQAEALIAFIKNNELLISPEKVLTEYTPKSKLRERVLAMRDEPGGGFAELTANVARELFASQPDPQTVVNSMAQFWYDMPVDIRASYFSELKKASSSPDSEKQNRNTNYMKKLTSLLNKNPLWEKITGSSITAEAAGQAELEAGRAAAAALKAGPNVTR